MRNVVSGYQLHTNSAKLDAPNFRINITHSVTECFLRNRLQYLIHIRKDRSKYYLTTFNTFGRFLSK